MSILVRGPDFEYEATGVLPAKPTKGDKYIIDGKPFTVVNVICKMHTLPNNTVKCDPVCEIVLI